VLPLEEGELRINAIAATAMITTTTNTATSMTMMFLAPCGLTTGCGEDEDAANTTIEYF
jgi:hypothetical protein